MTFKNPIKEYNLQWMSLNDLKVNYTETVKTSNPKMVLFDFACKMIVMANSIFGELKVGTIAKNIQKGRTCREHYWIEYPGGEVLSIMETLDNKPCQP